MTDTLKNLATSVDWKKLLSSSDAKNALIGSALGGLMLGGASLASDRDPDESKMTPVGDALLGALLGGAAGYGIPKGLSLFQDAGSLAPDNDQLSGSALGAMSTGAALGAGSILAPFVLVNHPTSIARRLAYAKEHLPLAKETAATNLEFQRLRARELSVLAASDPSYAKALERQQLRLMAAEIEAAATAGRKETAKLRKFIREGRSYFGDRLTDSYLSRLKNVRRATLFGASGYGDIYRGIGNSPLESVRIPKVDASGKPIPTLTRLLMFAKDRARTQWAGSRYRPGPWSIGGMQPKNISMLAKLLKRTGKYGAGGALVGLLLHKALGNTSKSNFKN